MANIMTKRGSLDNIVTYEHYCDTVADLQNIPAEYTTLGSIAIVLQNENEELEAYIANTNKEWIPLFSGSGQSEGSSGVSFYICSNSEIDSETGAPDIEFPEENTFYLVPSTNQGLDLYDEWIYVNDNWEKFGSASGQVTTQQADWNQNDSSAADYIKNRICYETLGTIIDDEYEFASANYANFGQFRVQLSEQIPQDTTCNITVGTAINVSGTFNGSSLSYLNFVCDTGSTLPANTDIVQVSYNNTVFINIQSTSDVFTFTNSYPIKIEGLYAVKINKKYIPDVAWSEITEKPLILRGENPYGTGIGNIVANEIDGDYSLAVGNLCQIGANATNSFAQGHYCVASSMDQHVFGHYNQLDDSGVYVEIVGNGTGQAAQNRSNARTLDWNGNEWLAGSLTLGNTTLTEQALQTLLSLSSASGVSF